MKQALDSLLTFNQISLSAILDSPVLPRVKVGTIRRILTPINTCRERLLLLSVHSPVMLYPLHSLVRSRLGEGRIRSLLHRICLLCDYGLRCGFISGHHGNSASRGKGKLEVYYRSVICD